MPPDDVTEPERSRGAGGAARDENKPTEPISRRGPARSNGTSKGGPLNGVRLNGFPVAGDTTDTEPISRRPQPGSRSGASPRPVPEVPDLPEVTPADPGFWFGQPVPGEQPPGQVPPRRDPGTDWFPEAASRSAERSRSGDTHTRSGSTPARQPDGDVTRGGDAHHARMVPTDDTDPTLPPLPRSTGGSPRPPGSRTDLPVVGPPSRPNLPPVGGGAASYPNLSVAGPRPGAPGPRPDANPPSRPGMAPVGPPSRPNLPPAGPVSRQNPPPGAGSVSHPNMPVVGPRPNMNPPSRPGMPPVDPPQAGSTSRTDLPAPGERSRPAWASRNDLSPVPELLGDPDIEDPEEDTDDLSERAGLATKPEDDTEESEQSDETAGPSDGKGEPPRYDADLTALIPRVRARTLEKYPGNSGRSRRERVDEREGRKRGRHRRPPRRQPLWREILTLVAVALLLTFLIQHFIGRVYSIPSGSMEQTLHGCPGCDGDRVFVDKIIYNFRDPAPGDVVVFEGPNAWTEHDVKTDPGANVFVKGLRYAGSFIGIAPPDERDFVKRVIAVGGQTVECCDDKNRVLVDGKPLDEPYIYWENGVPNSQQQFERVTVPEGTLWVMGDNRNNSSDSRFQGGGGIRGVVPLGKVIGKARYIVLPPSRWRGVGDHNPQAGPELSAVGWQQGVPAGVGLAAAWPVLWVGRRLRNILVPRKAD